MKTKLEVRITEPTDIPRGLDKKPSETSYEYLRRATSYMSGTPKYKETLR